MPRTTNDSHGEPVRTLGAFERTIDFYMRRNPVQFSLVAEVAHPVTAPALTAALGRLQQAHPLLRVAVDRSGPQAVFREAEGAIPVETAADGTPWQSVVAAEQTRPIPATPGPLVRAVLLPHGAHCQIVLTFAHQITDGTGALRALLDLVAALDGAELPAGGVPAAQEELLARLEAPAAVPAPGAPAEGDERMDAPGELVAFAGRTPHVDALALDPELTERLVRRSRLEHTSVHAALCAAAAVVFHRRGREFVRVLSPVDLRRAAGLADDVVVRFAGARTGSTADEAKDFWTLARSTHAALSGQRAPDALQAGSAALAAHAPANGSEAESMMTAATAADIQITNLGAVDPGRQHLSAVSALWGPAQITQLSGEHILGVVTAGGQLRMTELTHDPVAALLPELAAVLAEECAPAVRTHV